MKKPLIVVVIVALIILGLGVLTIAPDVSTVEREIPAEKFLTTDAPKEVK